MNSKTVNMMDLRQHVGALVAEVIYQQKQIIVKKHDKPVCMIVPYQPNSSIQQPVSRQARLKKLYGVLKYQKKDIKKIEMEYKRLDDLHDQKLQAAWNKTA